MMRRGFSMIGLLISMACMVALMARELTLVGSMCYAHDRRVGDFARALEVLSRHRDVLGELITHRFSLDQVRQALEVQA